MKPFLLFLSFLISLPVFSQHYRTVLVDKEVYFDFKDKGNEHRLIEPISYQVQNSDTIVYHRLNDEYDLQLVGDDTIQIYDICGNYADTGFLGYYNLLRSNGTDIFFNYNQDSIFIQTQANLNDNWIFFQESNGNYYEAMVVTIDTQSILGIIDSVKTITIQKKDNQGNFLNSPYDTLLIHLSKHLGLTKAFNFFRFPSGVTNLDRWNYSIDTSFKQIFIIGLPHMNLGVNNLTAAKIYDFDIGDVFQHSQRNGAATHFYKNTIILSKQFSPNHDSVHYTAQVTRLAGQYLDTIFHGIEQMSYDISPNNILNTKILKPVNENNNGFIYAQSFSHCHNRLMKTKSEAFGFDTTSFYCEGPLVTSPFWVYKQYYTKGLGRTFYGQNGANLDELTLEYYKKGTETCGTPLDFDALVNSQIITKPKLSLKVFPNPTNNFLNFQFTEPINNAEIRIYSSIGQLMLNQNVNDMNMKFDVSDWHKGVYFYVIAVEGEVVKQGQVLIQD